MSAGGLAAPGLAVLGLAALWGLRRRGGPWTPEAWALRLGILAACALAGAAPSLELGEGDRLRVLVLDRSRSLARGQGALRPALAACFADLGERDAGAVVLAGAEPVLSLAPRAGDALDPASLEAAWAAPLDPWGSDLGAALRLGASVAESWEGPAELLLVSDGRDTGGEAAPAAAELSRAGLRLHAFAPDAAPPFGARLARLEAPARAAPGERLAVLLVAETRRPARLRLSLDLVEPRGPRRLAQLERAADPARPLVVTLLTPPLPGGQPELLLRGTVRVSGRDDAPEDDRLETRVRLGAAPSLVVVGEPLAGLAASQLPPGELAARLAAAPPQAVVLHELPADQLGASVPALDAALQAGMALVVLGARRAFGPGGYAESPLESLLPVRCGPGEERQRPLQLMVALDASGSMAEEEEGRSRYRRALAAALPLELLRPGDRLGVVCFAGEAELSQPLGPVPPGLRERLARREPGGGTDLGAALVRALEELARGARDPVPADRLLILASDAEDPDPGRHAARLEALAASLAEAAPQLLLIHIGSGPLKSLEELARRLAPLTCRVQRARDLDDSLRELVEGELLARRAELRAGRFRLTATPAGAGLRALLPAEVAAYAPVRPREELGEGVEVWAQLQDPETGDPPGVVVGRRGLGRVAAIPLAGTAGARLLPRLWGELLPRDRGLELRLVRSGSRLEVEARGAALPPETTVWIRAPEGELRAPLIPRTPRRHGTTLRAPGAGPLRAVLLGPGGERLATAAAPAAAHEELARPGADLPGLQALCAATGGRLLARLPSARHPLDPAQPAGEGRLGLAPWLALLALALLVAEAGAGTLRARWLRPPAT